MTGWAMIGMWWTGVGARATGAAAGEIGETGVAARDPVS